MADKYDPDRMNADDIDPNDTEAIDAWLNHPNTQAMNEDLGRAFRAEPAGMQRAEIERYIEQQEPKLAELQQRLETTQYPHEVRAALATLLDAMTSHITAARLRLRELDEQ